MSNEFKKWFAARARNPDRITLEEAFAAGARSQCAPSVPEGFACPECPKRRQSHVLFDDGYEEGWAACMAAVQALLAAAPEAKPCP